MKIDLTYLKNVSGGNKQLILEMSKIFTEQIAEYSSEMTVCLETKNWALLGRIAHKAKTAVAIMGMSELSDVMRTLELSAKEEKNTENFPVCIKKFIEETDIAINELNNILKNLKD